MKTALLVPLSLILVACAGSFSGLPGPENYGINSDQEIGSFVYDRCRNYASDVTDVPGAVDNGLGRDGRKPETTIFNECMAENGYPFLSKRSTQGQ